MWELFFSPFLYSTIFWIWVSVVLFVFLLVINWRLLQRATCKNLFVSSLVSRDRTEIYSKCNIDKMSWPAWQCFNSQRPNPAPFCLGWYFYLITLLGKMEISRLLVWWPLSLRHKQNLRSFIFKSYLKVVFRALSLLDVFDRDTQ